MEREAQGARWDTGSEVSSDTVLRESSQIEELRKKVSPILSPGKESPDMYIPMTF